MSALQPHIITEGTVQYPLGELKGNNIHYDFKKILIYLNVKGKLLFGKNFKLYEEDEVLLFKLCIYFIKDYDYCKKLKIDPNKGLLLSGPVGCGKTSLMKLLQHIVPHRRPYELTPARNIVFSFNNNGYSVIEHYGSTHYHCFDGLGIEPIGRYFGKDCNVMGEILLSRYDLFCHPESPPVARLNDKVGQGRAGSQKIKTHAITHLKAEALKDHYGNQVYSRIRELFNWIAFDETTKDKRK
jgi:hypothetical protein